MRKLSGLSLSIHTFCSIQGFFFADSEYPDQTVRMRRLIWAFRFPHMLEDTFLHGAVHVIL